MDRLARREDEYKIGLIKRFMEHESMIPGFMDKMKSDPEGTLKEYGLPLTVEEVTFRPGDPDDHFIMKPVYPESDLSLYVEFMRTKFAYRDEIKKADIPDNEAMRKWHKRQQGRCIAEMGARCDSIVHVPLTVELADGCSVGCKFCGLNAGKLKSVFRYTDENAQLFNDVMIGAKDLLGDCVGQGTLYFASEPLDNPDYEYFLADFRKIFGRIPQITTATALRHRERMHKLLKELNEDGRTIYRFSVLSLEDLFKIFEEFSPEELVYTELLSQYEEAPQSGFVDVGRRGEKKGGYEGTISCVTGFIINFCRKEVRLTAPANACDERPTGEIIFETAAFDDAEGCIEAMKAMISRYMLNIIDPKDRIRLRSGLKWRMDGDDIVVEGDKYSRFTITVRKGSEIYRQMLEMFADGYRTKREIVADLVKQQGGSLVRSDLFHYAINRLWELGILELESGKV